MAWLGVPVRRQAVNGVGHLLWMCPGLDLTEFMEGGNKGLLRKNWLHSPASGPGLWCPGLGAAS